MKSDVDTDDLIRSEVLPIADWQKYYERIFVDERIKQKLVNYGLLLDRFDRLGLDSMTLAYHGAVLLYGPPGTGKTTLSRGVANRVARLLSNDEDVIYREVRVEQLFSGTLGDTPKAVGDVFDKLIESAQVGTKQIILFDEVESLISNRDTLVGETDPMDVARAVNVALERIDELADYPNVYLISTSNLPSAVDSAFFDRADVHFRIGMPSAENRYRILEDVFESVNQSFDCSLPTTESQLEDVVELTDGFSGRRIRKMVLESIVSERSTIKDPSQFQLKHVEETARTTRTRLLEGDANDAVETDIYATENSEEQTSGLEKDAMSGEGSESGDEPDESAGEGLTEASPSAKDESRTFTRSLYVDATLEAREWIVRLKKFLDETLEEIGHQDRGEIHALFDNESFVQKMKLGFQSEELTRIKLQFNNKQIFLNVEYGKGNDAPVESLTSDVANKFSPDSVITLSIVTGPNSFDLGLEQLGEEHGVEIVQSNTDGGQA